MYTHQKIIASILSGVVLTMGFPFSSNAQDKKPEKHVQIKVIENGKVKTDTSFTVDHNINPKDLDVMIDELTGDKYIHPLGQPGHGKKHSKDVMVYRYHHADDLDNMDSMMKDMDREFRNNEPFFTKIDSGLDQHFKLKGGYDSIVMYKDGKREKMMPNGFPESFDMPMPPPCPGCMPRGNSFYFRNFNSEDQEGSPDEERHVIIRKHAGKGEKEADVEKSEDINYEIIENDADVTIKRKVSPGGQQIIVEKTNPEVTIKKGKKGRIEITIEEKNSEKKEKK